MRLKLLPFLVFLLPLGCSEPDICCTVYDTGVLIEYVNANGENLFEIPGGLTENQITTYLKEDGKWVYYHGGGTEFPRGVKIVETPDGPLLQVAPGLTTDTEGYSELKLIFSETDIDSMRTKIETTGNLTVVSEVWYNNELKWRQGPTERKFQVVKWPLELH